MHYANRNRSAARPPQPGRDRGRDDEEQQHAADESEIHLGGASSNVDFGQARAVFFDRHDYALTTRAALGASPRNRSFRDENSEAKGALPRGKISLLPFRPA